MRVTLKVPQVRLRTEEMRVPTDRAAALWNTAKGQPTRLAGRFPWKGKSEPQVIYLEAAKSGLRPKALLLLAGGALGAVIGIALAPNNGKTNRKLVADTAQKAARITGKQTGRQARYISKSIAGRARAVQARVGGSEEFDTAPKTISERVQTELGRDRKLSALPRINVNTEPGGVVYLRGAVPSESERERAEKIARKVRGVSEVVNEINLTGQATSGGDSAVQ